MRQFVIVADVKFRPFSFVSDGKIGAILQKIADGASLGDPVLVLTAQASKPIRRKIDAMAGTRIYQKV
jgi:hypothetical protein